MASAVAVQLRLVWPVPALGQVGAGRSSIGSMNVALILWTGTVVVYGIKTRMGITVLWLCHNQSRNGNGCSTSVLARATPK